MPASSRLIRSKKPKFFGNSEEGKAAELNYKLGTQLPYMYVA